MNFRSVPVKDLLEDGGTSAQAKEKVRFIQEVKRYGEEQFGLKRTKRLYNLFGGQRSDPLCDQCI